MWTITNDMLEEGKKVGTSSCDYDKTKTFLLPRRFRMLDDDGEIYYEGVSDDCDSERAFEPLDDFGEGYAGCTQIHYFDGQSWKQL
jgi:hypothetical protein